eukprot:CAMPEP_0181381412 /NCGR_PEP_ID=MMETSP1106-20121128/20108_1 /TAXON_ID=81844 /ORGANISM="Mantoniella antarctica, Strain SL-175" /LENGTH=87 /DNA_ID=CAMNT_0023500595 /DNA_START=33 /DNA_END=293 /DNA_ORIENTATION=-
MSGSLRLPALGLLGLATGLNTYATYCILSLPSSSKPPNTTLATQAEDKDQDKGKNTGRGTMGSREQAVGSEGVPTLATTPVKANRWW